MTRTRTYNSSLNETLQFIKKYWRVLLFYFITISTVILLALFRNSSESNTNEDIDFQEYITPEKLDRNITIDYKFRFFKKYKIFKDNNSLHLNAALRIHPHVFENTLSDKDKRKLKHLKTTQYYHLGRLRYSEPYLTPSAKKLLDNICQDFALSLKAQGYPPYKLNVTSLLRTIKQQKKLSRNNSNAAKRSAHCYGTTFDISWSKFTKVNKEQKEISTIILKRVLGGVLLQYQKAGICYIVHERKQACFHITTRI